MTCIMLPHAVLHLQALLMARLCQKLTRRFCQLSLALCFQKPALTS